MNYDDEVKNSAAFRSMTGKSPAHAYLIIAPDEEYARALCARFISSRIGVDPDKVLRRACADVTVLPFGDKVLSSDVKEITDTVALTPTESDEKFYVVEKAETMNESSQNKLLKVLEEPPAFVRIILIATSTAPFLPTVLSRVTVVDVPPLTEEEVLSNLIREYGETAAVYLAAALSGGSLSKAAAVMTERKHAEIYDAVMDTLKNMKSSRNAIGFSARLGGFKDDTGEVIDILEIILSDCMAASCGLRSQLRLKGAVRDVLEIAAGYDADVIVRIRPKIVRARKRLQFNGNPQSIIDELLFSMLEVKAKCRR